MPTVGTKQVERLSVQCVILGERWKGNSAALLLEGQSLSKIVVHTVSGVGEAGSRTEQYTLNLATLEWSSSGPANTD